MIKKNHGFTNLFTYNRNLVIKAIFTIVRWYVCNKVNQTRLHDLIRYKQKCYALNKRVTFITHMQLAHMEYQSECIVLQYVLLSPSSKPSIIRFLYCYKNTNSVKKYDVEIKR